MLFNSQIADIYLHISERQSEGTSRPLLNFSRSIGPRRLWLGQKNEENNKKNSRFVRRCSMVMCPVSPTPRFRSDCKHDKQFFQ